jgi:hypothetical protein
MPQVVAIAVLLTDRFRVCQILQQKLVLPLWSHHREAGPAPGEEGLAIASASAMAKASAS